MNNVSHFLQTKIKNAFFWEEGVSQRNKKNIKKGERLSAFSAAPPPTPPLPTPLGYLP
jgi:hypothetical protein